MALSWTRPDSLDTDEWRQAASCRSVDPVLFFPVGTTGPSVEHIQEAKAVCATCPVQAPCLEFALVTNQESGIWGGASEDDRRVLRRQRQRRRSA